MNPIATHQPAANRWKVGLILFSIGFLGVLSLLLMDLPLKTLPKAVLQRFTPTELKLLILINPTLLLLIAVVVGTLLYQKTTLRLLPNPGQLAHPGRSLLMDGIVPGLIAGLLILTVAAFFQRFIPQELAQLNQAAEPPVAVRFLYGGITEEILLRFGLMTLLVWLITRLIGYKASPAYWVAITLSALISGLGHLPIVYSTVNNPSQWLVLHIILGNVLGGLIFGWVYWRKSLAMAMVAHAMTHVVFITVAAFV